MKLSHVLPRIGGLALGGSAFEFDGLDATRGAICMAARGSCAIGAAMVGPGATPGHRNDLDGGSASAIKAVTVSDASAGCFVEDTARPEFGNCERRVSGFLSGSGAFSGEPPTQLRRLGLTVV